MTGSHIAHTSFYEYKRKLNTGCLILYCVICLQINYSTMDTTQLLIDHHGSSRPSVVSLLYLNEVDADIWFIIDDFEGCANLIRVRVPGHQFILEKTVPFYKKDLKDVCNEIYLFGVSDDALKEFLKFSYELKPNLTMGNIESVMHMAKRWKAKEIFSECKQFLKKSMDISTICLGYRLAVKYRLNDLKAIFQDEICVNAEMAFRSDTFLKLPYELIAKMLECDSLACKEIDIFEACIKWTKVSRQRNDWDPSDAIRLRNQFRNLLHQIRFTSMTTEEAATCIDSHSQLFTEDELQEILCMIGHFKQFKPKQFNWTVRYYNLQAKEDLVCSRFCRSDDVNSIYNLQNNNTQVTQFTCNRRIELHGIECEKFDRKFQIRIIEKNPNGQINMRYNRERSATDVKQHSYIDRQSHNKQHSYTACLRFNKSIILRPNYTYDICITYPNLEANSHSLRELKQKVRVDYDTVFRFTERGVVTALIFKRIKARNYFRKIIHSPTLWIWILIIMTILFSSTAFYIWPYAIFSIFLFICLLIVRASKIC